MPLFFLVSGFFTAMMWKKRGMEGLVRQRLLRIGVPLLAGMLIFYPAMIALGSWGERVKAERVEEGNGGLDFQGLPLSRESKKLSVFCIYDGCYNCS